MEDLSFKLLLLIIFVSSIFPSHTSAHIAHFDGHWKQRAEEARKHAEQAYNHNPHEATHHFNHNVTKALEGSKTTRRNLGGNDGSCQATNPIDQCWRCKNDWAANRMRLADCVLGFGAKTTGGKNGKYYVVNDSSDADMVNPIPGTLRHAVIQPEPLWIIFSKSMVITLSQELIMTSDKTVDGRGVEVHIQGGAGFTLQFVKNIIIHGIHIHDIKPRSGGMIRDSVQHFGLRTQSDGDGVSIFGGSNIWIDHLSMWNCYDGLVDAIMASTAITVSNCKFRDHDEVMLFGGSNSTTQDEIMQITVAFNHFDEGLIQRMPRCRFGFVHVVNNDYSHWHEYALGGSQHPTIISQGNRFIAPQNPFAKAVTRRAYAPESEWKNWLWTSEDDLLVNGAIFVESGDLTKKGSFAKKDSLVAKPATFVEELTRFSGALNCVENTPC
ncbi:hypothetical protein Dimus_023908 [Dionaea muscipula]